MADWTPPNAMVERVARAICRAHFLRRGCLPEDTPQTVDDLWPVFREAAIDALAAIPLAEAMQALGWLLELVEEGYDEEEPSIVNARALMARMGEKEDGD
jgi:hypothetical protein